MDIKLEGKDKYYDFLSEKEQNILNKASKEGASRLDKALWTIASNGEYQEIILQQVKDYAAVKLAVSVKVEEVNGEFKVSVTKLNRTQGNGAENNHIIPVSVFLKALNHRLTSKAFSNGIDLLEHVKDFYSLNYKNNIYYRFIYCYIEDHPAITIDNFELLLRDKVIGSIYQNWNERPYATYVDKREDKEYSEEGKKIKSFIDILETQ